MAFPRLGVCEKKEKLELFDEDRAEEPAQSALGGLSCAVMRVTAIFQGVMQLVFAWRSFNPLQLAGLR